MNIDGKKLNFRWKREKLFGKKKNSVEQSKINVTYPRFGPFGARIGNAIPTKPQNAVIKITGMAPMFIESIGRKWNGKTIKKRIRKSCFDYFGIVLFTLTLSINHKS